MRTRGDSRTKKNALGHCGLRFGMLCHTTSQGHPPNSLCNAPEAIWHKFDPSTTLTNKVVNAEWSSN